MNTSNVIQFGVPHAVPCAKRGHPAALNPVRVRFDAFELDEPNAPLLRDGKAVSLAPKPFEVLCALARTPGSLLTKNALFDLVWGHRAPAIARNVAAGCDNPALTALVELCRGDAALADLTRAAAAGLERERLVLRDS